MSLKTIFDLLWINIRHLYFKQTNQHHRIIPYKILIEVTTNCNSRCIHCHIWNIDKDKITTINLVDLEPFLKLMGPNLLWVALSGGEISNFNQLPELISLLKRYNPRLRIITFTTNGLLPKRILQQALLIKKELNCDMFITVSLDGDRKTHDLIRGVKGNFDKAIQTLHLLKQNKIPSHFGITVSTDNEEFIQNEFNEYRKDIKAVTFIHTEGIYLTNKQNESNEKDARILSSLRKIYKQYQIAGAGEIIMKISIKIAILFLKKRRATNIIPCDAGYSSVHIFSNGDISPCMYFKGFTKIGDAFALKEFHNVGARQIKEQIKRDECAHCWMNCYAPHSIFQAPIRSLAALFK